MIVSHRHRFIFLKTNKTAGTSVEIALSKHCGEDDVITPMGAEDEQLRSECGGRPPQNCHAPLRDYAPKDILKLLALGRRKLRFYNHMGAALVRQLVGADVWQSYFKFCVERNPFDRAISLYYHRAQMDSRVSLSEFLASDELLRLKHKGFELYAIDGRVVVDRVCLFEKLEADLASVCAEIGLPRLTLPRAKSSFRGDRRNYREVLSDTDRERVETVFPEEMELFGYTF